MRVSRFFLGLAVLSTLATAQLQKHTLKPAFVRKDIHRADVDAKKEIQEAIERARPKAKRVMLVFGGNWCYDCHVLDAALRDPAIAPTFTKYYELVHVDIGQG